VLAGVATVQTAPREIDTSLAKQAPTTAPGPATGPLPGSDVPLAEDDPLAGVAAAGANGAATAPAPSQKQGNGSQGVPLAQ
jgi:preprotein translocase subunit SecG